MNEEQIRAEIRNIIGRSTFSGLVKELRKFIAATDGVSISLPDGELSNDTVELIQKMSLLGMRDALISIFDIVEMNKDDDAD